MTDKVKALASMYIFKMIKTFRFLITGAYGITLCGMLLSACDGKIPLEEIKFSSITPSFGDELRLADGLKYDVLIKWEDNISEEQFFGYNSNFTAFLPSTNDEGLLWVNHEYIDPKFVSGYFGDIARMRKQVEKEMENVGGTIIKISSNNNKWQVVKNDSQNRKITAKTKIPFAWPELIKGKKVAMGTLANSAGSVTPWGTILTCEENYGLFYGETSQEGKHVNSIYEWEIFHYNPPEHYGWVVEVDPNTGDAKKIVSIGRYAHGGVTMKELSDGRIVVYSSDHRNGGSLYKFISDSPGSIETGALYVANLGAGKWEALDYNSQPLLQASFQDQTDVLIHASSAGGMVGGTALDRPSDIKIDPVTGSVFIALHNNIPNGNFHGSILKIDETQSNYDALTFEWDTFLEGGQEGGFSSPDHMRFDHAGNLWFTSDISSRNIGSNEYEAFGNNGLFLVKRESGEWGQSVQIAAAPVDAEFAGLSFSPDGKWMFLSVQHPGERSKTIYDRDFTSHWPEGGDAIPRSAVIVVSGI